VRELSGHMAEGTISNKWKYEGTPYCTGCGDATSAKMFCTPARQKIAGGAGQIL
jgi:hypothetical protein